MRESEIIPVQQVKWSHDQPDPVQAVRFKWDHGVLEVRALYRDADGFWQSRHGGLMFNRQERRKFFAFLKQRRTVN